MRMLFVCFVVILFISGKSANPVEHVDNIEASGETENTNNDEDAKAVKKSVTEQLNNENEMPKEVVKEYKRPKKSPCAPCGGYSNQYAQPSVAYSSPPISYGPQIAYGPPSYGGYSAPPPVYGQPQYRPRYGGRKGNYIIPVQAYQPPQPSYQPPQPTYQPPQPSYQPQPTYQPSPSYQQLPAPVYSRPSYKSPSYGNQVSSAPVYPGPSQSYSYSSPSPTVPCSSNLLFGCQPHVSEVPCSGYYPSYGSPAYPPQQYHQPAYRSNSDDKSASAQGPSKHSNEMTPNNSDDQSKTTKDNSVSSILSAPVEPSADKNSGNDKHENNGNTQKGTNVSASNQQAQSEEEKRRLDTLKQLAEMAKISDDKSKQQQNNLSSSQTQQNNMPSSQTQQNNMPSSQTQQNNIPYMNKQQTNDKQNKGPSSTFAGPQSTFAGPQSTFAGPQSTFSNPQPTSVIVGAPNNNQVNTIFPQFPNPWI